MNLSGPPQEGGGRPQPGWLSTLVTLAGVTMGFLELVYDHGQSWPIVALAGSMILGGTPASWMDALLKAKGQSGGGGTP